MSKHYEDLMLIDRDIEEANSHVIQSMEKDKQKNANLNESQKFNADHKQFRDEGVENDDVIAQYTFANLKVREQIDTILEGIL